MNTKDFASAFRNIPRAFRLLRESDPSNAVWLGLITVLDGVLPLSHAWATKLIVDGVVSAMGAGVPAEEGLRRIAPYLALEFGLIFLSSVLAQARALVEQLIDHKLGHAINTRIIRKALSLEMRYFEDAAFYDKMQNARRQSEYRAMALVRGAFLLVQNIITLTSFLVLLLAFNPWIAAILFCATMPAFVNQSRYSNLNFRLQTWRAPETRHMYYMESLLTQDSSMKEVKLFGLGEPLLKRYAELFWKIFREDAELARGRSVKSLLWGLLATITYYGAYAWVIALTVGKKLSIGDMTLYLALFRQSQGAFEGLLGNVNALFENGLFLENLFEFLGLKPQMATLDAATRPAEDPVRGIEFENVWFRYPGAEAWTIENVSFKLDPGEKIALVGENGAGKTTLIKLLTRLYEPTQGRILFHGVDLRYFSMEELHRRVGAIFQDFVHYHFTVRENIGFGWIEKLDENERILRAAMKGGANEVADALPHKYETRLGKQWDEGHELSGGQWQKVALSRAFMREAEVLILDEPTSALDAEAEYEIFQKFRELTEGRIALLVSHRFSTVRMADRIVVLRGGKIEELGSHVDLIARRGTYARLFEMQAEGYR